MSFEDYRIRMATSEDAEKLLEIYRYYVENTAITFEYDVPTVDEFKKRIETVLEKFPYIVVEEVKKAGNLDKKDGDISGRILGYCYVSPFHPRAAYQWCVETSIYIDKDCKGMGLGKLLYLDMEKRLKKQGVLNLNACIGVPSGAEDEHLTFDSVNFHKHMGYSMVGEFHQCGYKFGKWYNMVWMEKMIGEHTNNPEAIKLLL